MRNTGMTRPVDQLGRIVLPMELRKAMGLHEGTRLEIWTDKGGIVLRRSDACCVCCGRTSDHMMERNGLTICRDCLERFEPVGGNER